MYDDKVTTFLASIFARGNFSRQTKVMCKIMRCSFNIDRISCCWSNSLCFPLNTLYVTVKPYLTEKCVGQSTGYIS